MGVVKNCAQRSCSLCSIVLPARKIPAQGSSPSRLPQRASLCKKTSASLSALPSVTETSCDCWIIPFLALFRVLSWHLPKSGFARLSVLAQGVRRDYKLAFSVTDCKRDTRRQMCQASVVESLGWRQRRLNLMWVLVLKKRGNRSKSWKPPACCFAGRERKI